MIDVNLLCYFFFVKVGKPRGYELSCIYIFLGDTVPDSIVNSACGYLANLFLIVAVVYGCNPLFELAEPIKYMNHMFWESKWLSDVNTAYFSPDFLYH